MKSNGFHLNYRYNGNCEFGRKSWKLFDSTELHPCNFLNNIELKLFSFPLIFILMGGLFFHNVVWILESNDNPFPNLCFRKISFIKRFNK